MIREVLAFTVGAALATGFFYAMEADYRHELEIAQMKLVQEKLRRETLMTDTLFTSNKAHHLLAN